MIWLRWTLPRLRIDQVMTTCLKYCVPLASAMLVGAMLWMYLFPGGLIARAVAMSARTCGSRRRSELNVPRGVQHPRNTGASTWHCVTGRWSQPWTPINWHSSSSCCLPWHRLRVRRGGGGDRQHRAHGLLPGRVAGRGGRAVLPGRGRFPRRRATDGLRRRHDGAAGVRRDAHRPGPVRLDEDRRRAMDLAAVLVGGSLLAVLSAGGVERAGLGRGRTISPRRSRPPPTATPAGTGADGRPRRSASSSRTRCSAGGMSGYLLAFEIISVHLVVVLVGAAYLARAEDAERSRQRTPTRCP